MGGFWENTIPAKMVHGFKAKAILLLLFLVKFFVVNILLLTHKCTLANYRNGWPLNQIMVVFVESSWSYWISLYFLHYPSCNKYYWDCFLSRMTPTQKFILRNWEKSHLLRQNGIAPDMHCESMLTFSGSLSQYQ